MTRRANELMATQLKGKKRLMEEVDIVKMDHLPEKRAKIAATCTLFKTPQFGNGGIYNPPQL